MTETNGKPNPLDELKRQLDKLDEEYQARKAEIDREYEERMREIDRKARRSYTVFWIGALIVSLMQVLAIALRYWL